MIDVKEEIKKYKVINIEEKLDFHESNIFDNELAEIMKIFAKTFDRLGKEQYKSSNKLDEIIIALEEKEEEEQSNRELKEKIKDKEEEIKVLLRSLISLADLIEDMYVYSKKTENLSLKHQITLQWNNVKNYLAQCGITIIGDEGGIFNSELYKAVEIKYIEEKTDGEVLEVLKSGYIYKGKLLRKAEVIVNSIK